MYRQLAENDFIKKMDAKGAVFMGWYRDKSSSDVEKYFARFDLTPGYYTGGQQPWADGNDTNTLVASAATVIDLRTGAIIYSSARQAADAAAIIKAIEAAK